MTSDAKLYYADLDVLLDAGYYNKIINEISDFDMPSNHQLIYKAKALRLMGMNSEALQLLNNINVSSNLTISLQSLRERGHILLEMGYYETAENMVNETFEILSIIRSSEFEIQNVEADILHTAGNLNSFKGDFQNALKFWERSLLIKKTLGKVIDQAIIVNNIAIYYSVIEEYDRSLEFFYEALRLIKPFEIPKIISGILLNIGDTYFYSGYLGKALDFVHRSLDLAFGDKMDYIKSNCLVSLIKYYLIVNDKISVERYYNELIGLATVNQSIHIQLLEKYSKAIILKSNNNEIDNQYAKSLFQQFLNPSILDYQLFYNIVLHLAELLLNELYENESLEAFDELLKIIGELYEDAQEKQLFHYLIDTLILKSKILLIRKDFNKSRFLLNQAIIIAEDNKFDAFKRKVKMELMELEEKISSYSDSEENYTNLTPLLDLSGLRLYLEYQLTNRNSKDLANR